MNPTKVVLPAIMALLLTAGTLVAQAGEVPLRHRAVEKDGIAGVEYWSGERLVERSAEAAPAGVELLLPGAKPAPVRFTAKTESGGVIELGPAKIGKLTFRWRIAPMTPAQSGLTKTSVTRIRGWAANVTCCVSPHMSKATG